MCQDPCLTLKCQNQYKQKEYTDLKTQTILISRLSNALFTNVLSLTSKDTINNMYKNYFNNVNYLICNEILQFCIEGHIRYKLSQIHRIFLKRADSRCITAGNSVPTSLLPDPQQMESSPGHMAILSFHRERSEYVPQVIGELANHEATAEMVDVLNVDFCFSVIY